MANTLIGPNFNWLKNLPDPVEVNAATRKRRARYMNHVRLWEEGNLEGLAALNTELEGGAENSLEGRPAEVHLPASIARKEELVPLIEFANFKRQSAVIAFSTALKKTTAPTDIVVMYEDDVPGPAGLAKRDLKKFIQKHESAFVQTVFACSTFFEEANAKVPAVKEAFTNYKRLIIRIKVGLETLRTNPNKVKQENIDANFTELLYEAEMGMLNVLAEHAAEMPEVPDISPLMSKIKSKLGLRGGARRKRKTQRKRKSRRSH